jgi:hypothetical protein
MKTNEAGWDRVVRSLAGIVLIVLNLIDIITGGWGIAAVVVGAILLVTGVTGFCPLYALLKIKTKKA